MLSVCIEIAMMPKSVRTIYVYYTIIKFDNYATIHLFLLLGEAELKREYVIVKTKTTRVCSVV